MSSKSRSFNTAFTQSVLLSEQDKKNAIANRVQSEQAHTTQRLTAQVKPVEQVVNATVQPSVVTTYKLSPNYGKFYTQVASNDGLTAFKVACDIAEKHGFTRRFMVNLAGKDGGKGQPVHTLFNPLCIGNRKYMKVTQSQLNSFFKELKASNNLSTAIKVMEAVK